jgi:hypothetical protein
VLRRIRSDPRYRPRNLPKELIQQICDMPDVALGAIVTVPGSDG